MLKILIGGSPCTHWSISQKKNRETEPEGHGWELFKNYLIAKEKFKPDFFLYENNKSAAQAIKDQISHELGVPLMYINSALVSAQNRQRFYAFNWEVDQPEDRGILLKDIPETGEGLMGNYKSYALTTRCGQGAIPEDTIKRHRHTMVAEPVGVGYRGRMKDGKWIKRFESNGEPKANALTIATTDSMVGELIRISTIENIGDAETIQKALPKLVDKYGYIPEQFNAYNVAEITKKTPTLSTGSMVTSSCATTIFEKSDKHVYEVKNGLITIKGKQYPIKLADGHYIMRKLTPVECERLQTLPDGYTKAVSDTQRYRGLGNGWTAEIIIHVLNGALKDIPRDEEIVVLSMYDGIGTGRYCLDKMGFTNVRYYAYEIDKYAKQVAMSNYPDIIQMGDAFDVRKPNWALEY